MKILANHGGDPRFSFLRRGKEQRWSEEWTRLRDGQTVNLDKKGEGARSSIISTNLVDYGSSSDVEEEEEDAQIAKKKRKLQLAREWSRKRKEKASDEQG
jgi:hypothetical protein